MDFILNTSPKKGIINQISIKWLVKRFNNGSVSPYFTFSQDKSTPIELQLEHIYEKDKNGIRIYLKSKDSKEYPLYWQISLLDLNGSMWNTQSELIPFDNNIK